MKEAILSMLWKPDVSPARAVRLTSYAAVAVCDGIKAAVGVQPSTKWTNGEVSVRGLWGYASDEAGRA